MSRYSDTPTYNSIGEKTMIEVATNSKVNYTVSSTVQTDVYDVQVVLKNGSSVRADIDNAVTGDSSGSIEPPIAGIGLNVTTVTGVITLEVLQTQPS